ncbi:YdeI/OmpD-associated family protein [Pontimicrobium sp. MEBiC06410]
MQSELFNITLTDKYSVVIPNRIATLFLEANQKRVKVKASHKDHNLNFYAALKKEKTGLCRIYFSNAKQKELQLEIGDTFSMQLFEDTSKYGVDMPEALEAVLLSDYEAFSIFEGFTAGKQRSIIYAIKRYKNIQTQVDKSLIMTENLKRGIHDLKLILKAN